jgi:hypothetical protein
MKAEFKNGMLHIKAPLADGHGAIPLLGLCTKSRVERPPAAYGGRPPL